MTNQTLIEILQVGLTEEELTSGVIDEELIKTFLQKFPDYNTLKEFLSHQEQMDLLYAIGKDNTTLLFNSSFNQLPIMKKSQIIFKVPETLLSKIKLANYFK
jgi:hypothetical protein